jgi:hypothetical protein
MTRTGEKFISTPAMAREVARRAIQRASYEERGSFWELVTAKVFTAFMFEGVIHHLGEKLEPQWNSPRERGVSQKPRPALARKPLDVRHRAVRSLLSLDNEGPEYEDIRCLVSRLIEFRDCFAHPKEHRAEIADEVSSEFDAMPEIAWQPDVRFDTVNGDFDRIETYCGELLKTASDLLKRTYEGWTVWQQKYPHLRDLKLEAACFSGFLYCTAHSTFSYIR